MRIAARQLGAAFFVELNWENSGDLCTQSFLFDDTGGAAVAFITQSIIRETENKP